MSTKAVEGSVIQIIGPVGQEGRLYVVEAAYTGGGGNAGNDIVPDGYVVIARLLNEDITYNPAAPTIRFMQKGQPGSENYNNAAEVVFAGMMTKIFVPAAPLPDEAVMTLGARLKAQNAKRDEDKDLAARQRAEAVDRQRRLNEQKVRHFVEDELSRTTFAIEGNQPLKYRRIPNDVADLSGNRYGSIFLDNPKHPFYDVFVPIAAKIEGETGLKFKFIPQHDGGGVESWGEVIMEPV